MSAVSCYQYKKYSYIIPSPLSVSLRSVLEPLGAHGRWDTYTEPDSGSGSTGGFSLLKERFSSPLSLHLHPGGVNAESECLDAICWVSLERKCFNLFEDELNFM